MAVYFGQIPVSKLYLGTAQVTSLKFGTTTVTISGGSTAGQPIGLLLALTKAS